MKLPFTEDAMARHFRILLAVFIWILAGVGCSSEVLRRSQPRSEVRSAAGLNATWLPSSIFQTGAGWFPTTYQPFIWLADVNGDRAKDFIGIANDGSVYVAVATGTSFAPATLWASGTSMGAANGWYDTQYQQRVWLTDVTGDGRADIVGVANDGSIHMLESNGAGFNARHSTASVFSATYTSVTTFTPRVWAVDVTGDGKTDIVGISPSGDIRVARATGSGTSASFTSGDTWLASSTFSPNANWFDSTSQPRVWTVDVTGDGLNDVVGVAFDGTIWLSENLGNMTFAASHFVGTSTFRTDATNPDKNYFSTGTHEHVWPGDVNGDGRVDIVGVAPAGLGDGDVWASLSTPYDVGAEEEISNTNDYFRRRALLHDSIFKTGNGWFYSAYQGRVWLRDIDRDGRADLVGISNNGDIWVSRTTSERDTLSGERLLMLPSQKTGTSPFGFLLDPSTRPRIWLENVTDSGTGDGAVDLVGIAPSSAVTNDGDVLWSPAVATTHTAVSTLSRTGVFNGTPTPFSVTYARPLDPATVAATDLIVSVNGGAIVPTAVSLSQDQRTVEWTLSLPAVGDAQTTFEATVPSGALTDRWGNATDGDGDSIEGGDLVRRQYWDRRLMAGVAKIPLQDYSSGLSGIACWSGYGYAPAYPSGIGAVSAENPPYARAVVLAGGATCDSAADCHADQTCSHAQCVNPDGSEATRTIVLANIDAVGVNADRIRDRLERAYGIRKSDVFVSATHAHAVSRTIWLFTAPFFDNLTQPSLEDPFLTWIEDQIVASVGATMTSLVPVDVAFESTTVPGLQVNRRYGTPDPDPVANIVKLKRADTQDNLAIILNYALHVIEVESNEINADFPGYFASRVETSDCGGGNCVAMFINGGAGDVNPADDNVIPTTCQYPGDSAPWCKAKNIAHPLVDATIAAAQTAAPSTNLQFRIERRIKSFKGVAGCNTCRDNTPCDETRVNSQAPVYWDLESTSLILGHPSAPPIFALATMPGEPYSALQTQLRNSLNTSVPAMLFGYTNGYAGYFATSAAWQDFADRGFPDSLSYSLVVCGPPLQYPATNTPGPTFFDNSLGTTPGESMGAAAVTAITNRLLP